MRIAVRRFRQIIRERSDGHRRARGAPRMVVMAHIVREEMLREFIRGVLKEATWVADAPKRFGLPSVTVVGRDTDEAGREAAKEYAKQGVSIDPMTIDTRPSRGTPSTGRTDRFWLWDDGDTIGGWLYVTEGPPTEHRDEPDDWYARAQTRRGVFRQLRDLMNEFDVGIVHVDASDDTHDPHDPVSDAAVADAIDTRSLQNGEWTSKQMKEFLDDMLQ